MTHKEQVEKKIRELCPELMEPTGGCQVIITTQDSQPFDTITQRWLEPDGTWWYRTIGGYEMNYEIEDFTIIGSPIELRHVLRAIQESARWVFLGVAEDKLFFSRRKLANGESIEEGEPISYNLTRPFTDQDPALYKFLHSILCGKE